jgi:hypothetical protein
MNIKDLLQSVLDQADPEQENHSDMCHFYSEYRGAGGWWAIPFESRWFYDEGEFLGQNGFEALNSLKYMGFVVHEDVFTNMRRLTKKGKHHETGRDKKAIGYHHI